MRIAELCDSYLYSSTTVAIGLEISLTAGAGGHAPQVTLK
jgi:hypothetical protein